LVGINQPVFQHNGFPLGFIVKRIYTVPETHIQVYRARQSSNRDGLESHPKFTHLSEVFYPHLWIIRGFFDEKGAKRGQLLNWFH
jgi:hypothetical protein